MKKGILMALALMLCLTWSGLAIAAEADSPDQAKALVKKAVAMAKEKGMDDTLKAVADPKGPFVSGDYYIWAGALDKVIMVAHPHQPQLVNKDLTVYKDIKGKQFFGEFVVKAKEGGGWVDYYWPRPGTKEQVAKSSYVEAVPGQNVYFGCGIYKK
ncbi:MAG: cache domain-containing protein [Desulfarculus sp.]|nr:cache domain-containing protein [Desulfarculus sp.]